MTKPVIALSHPMFAGLVGMLSGQYEVLKVWDHASPMVVARGPGQKLQDLVAGG